MQMVEKQARLVSGRDYRYSYKDDVQPLKHREYHPGS
jgi:hypothetical protein